MVTFATEPGIIPARLWGTDVLPPKYKSADVRIEIKKANRV
jgi:hypothetical protein